MERRPVGPGNPVIYLLRRYLRLGLEDRQFGSQPQVDQHGMAAVDRFEFYRLAGAAYAILHTTEARLYGNFIIRKGVIESATDPAGA